MNMGSMVRFGTAHLVGTPYRDSDNKGLRCAEARFAFPEKADRNQYRNLIGPDADWGITPEQADRPAKAPELTFMVNNWHEVSGAAGKDLLFVRRPDQSQGTLLTNPKAIAEASVLLRSVPKKDIGEDKSFMLGLKADLDRGLENNLALNA